MALALSPKTASLSGKQALQAAIDDYKSVLLDAEKTRFDALKASGSADSFSVMTLTCEIDKSQATRLSRRLGPRLQPLLENIQRFSSIADTFSQVHSAGLLVWGSVKLTLMLTSNFGSYFEKVAELFLQIGCKAPHYDEYALLYRTSDALQNALCSYYACVVGLCRQVVISSRRRGVFQVPRAALLSFDHDFGAIKKEIDLASEEVTIQIHIASSKIQIQEHQMSQLERERNTESRKLLAKIGIQNDHEWSQLLRWREEKDLRRLKKQKDRLRKSFSTMDYRLPWRQARKECVMGTAVWYLKEPSFMNWLVSDTSKVLWLSGPMGSGKTIVAANIVAELSNLRDSSSKRCDIAYFFCQEERKESLSLRSIIGSIAVQLLEEVIDRASWSELESLGAAVDDSPGFHAIVEALKNYTACPGEHYIVIDGIDLCESQVVSGILDFCRALSAQVSSASRIKILLTARHDTGKEIFRIIQDATELRPSQDDIDRDMNLYVSNTLLKKLESGDLLLSDANLIEDIKDYLVVGSRGMLLWTKLLIEQICLCASDSEIIECLGSVPLKLADIYRRSLLRILMLPNSAIILQLLKWTLGSIRPLKPSELREAVTIVPGQKQLQIGSLPHNIEASIRDTKGLLYVDEDEDTVHIVHHSLKQALQVMAANSDTGSWQETFSHDALDLELGKLCMTYLSFEVFGRQLVKTKPTPSLTADDMSRLVQNVAEMSLSSKSITKTAVDLLRKSKLHSTKQSHLDSSSFAIDRKLREMAEEMTRKVKINTSFNHDFAFLKYAKVAWVEHTKKLSSDDDSAVWQIFQKTAASSDEHIDRPWESVTGSTWLDDDLKFALYPVHLVNALLWSYDNNHFGMMELQLHNLYLHHSDQLHSVYTYRNDHYWSPSVLVSIVKTILHEYSLFIVEVVGRTLKHQPSKSKSCIGDKIFFDILYDKSLYDGSGKDPDTFLGISIFSYTLTFDELARIKGSAPTLQIMAPRFRGIFIENQDPYPASLKSFFSDKSATFRALGSNQDCAVLNLVELSIACGRRDIFNKIVLPNIDRVRISTQAYWKYLGLAVMFGQATMAEEMWCPQLDVLYYPPAEAIAKQYYTILMLCMLQGLSYLTLNLLTLPKSSMELKVRAPSLILALRMGNAVVFQSLLQHFTYQELFWSTNWRPGFLGYESVFSEGIASHFVASKMPNSDLSFAESWKVVGARSAHIQHSSSFGKFDFQFRSWESSQLQNHGREIAIEASQMLESSSIKLRDSFEKHKELVDPLTFTPMVGILLIMPTFHGLLNQYDQAKMKRSLHSLRSRYESLEDMGMISAITKIERTFLTLINSVGEKTLLEKWVMDERPVTAANLTVGEACDALMEKFFSDLTSLISSINSDLASSS